MGSLFVTGGRGFIGRHFLRALDPARWEHIYCLSRAGDDLDAPILEHENVRVVTGDLSDADRYASALARCRTVVHLAAATGKASRAEYFRVNADGTNALLEASKRAGVRELLHVSSISARFASRTSYPYGESKRMAEDAVTASGLAYTIVRPTIVIGKEGASWRALAKLAALPLIPMFGNGRTRIQPIYVDDVAAYLRTILEANRFANETIELGGPEITTFKSLLREAHYLQRRRTAWTIGVPLRPLVLLLRLLEKIAPVNAGQLAAFQHDGTVGTAGARVPLPSRMRNVNEMLRLVIDNV